LTALKIFAFGWLAYWPMLLCFMYSAQKRLSRADVLVAAALALLWPLWFAAMFS